SERKTTGHFAKGQGPRAAPAMRSGPLSSAPPFRVHARRATSREIDRGEDTTARSPRLRATPPSRSGPRRERSSRAWAGSSERKTPGSAAAPARPSPRPALQGARPNLGAEDYGPLRQGPRAEGRSGHAEWPVVFGAAISSSRPPRHIARDRSGRRHDSSEPKTTGHSAEPERPSPRTIEQGVGRKLGAEDSGLRRRAGAPLAPTGPTGRAPEPRSGRLRATSPRAEGRGPLRPCGVARCLRRRHFEFTPAAPHRARSIGAKTRQLG